MYGGEINTAGRGHRRRLAAMVVVVPVAWVLHGSLHHNILIIDME